MHQHESSMTLVRRKRAWCPEWLWWFACNPIPFWNDTVAISYPKLRVWIAPATHLLSYPVENTNADQ